MGRHIFPRGDLELRQWTASLLDTVAADPQVYGIPPDELARQAQCQAQFDHWLAVARSGERTQLSVSRKNVARVALKVQTRRLLAMVGAQVDLPEDRRQALGLAAMRDAVRPGPPEEAPRLSHINSLGTTVEFHVRRSGPVVLRRPEGVIAAMIWTWAGPRPPADIQRQWQWAGNFHRRRVRVDFGLSRADGGEVWLAAAWINRLAQVGPVSSPLHVNVPGLTHVQTVRLVAPAHFQTT